jgi:hypothetical protein
MMSIFPPSNNAFLVLTRFATFLLQVRIRSYMNTQLERVNNARAACRSRLLRMEWSGLLVWWAAERNDCSGNTASGVRLILQRCTWLQQPDHLRYITIQVYIGFSFFSSSFGLRLCGDGKSSNVACVSTTMIHNAYVSIETPIFYFISNPIQFFLFLIWCNLLHRISYFGCSKHHVQFSLMLHVVVTTILVCFTLVAFLFYVFYHYSGCHAKIVNFNAEKFDVPHIAPK